MLYITQLIYVKEGAESIFHEFEEIAIPIIRKYNGQLLIRLRPDEHTVIAQTIEKPYEIHLIAFEAASDFENFCEDEERKSYLHLKESSIQSSLLIKGTKI
jgi:uncharacterized protein (DUF1330 family)